jgi:hypothetical protein
MAQEYEWTFALPAEQLDVQMLSWQDGAVVHEATLSLQRAPWTTGALSRALARHPAMACKVILAIHWQALRLALRRTPFFAHPKHRLPEANPR